MVILSDVLLGGVSGIFKIFSDTYKAVISVGALLYELWYYDPLLEIEKENKLNLIGDTRSNYIDMVNFTGLATQEYYMKYKRMFDPSNLRGSTSRLGEHTVDKWLYKAPFGRPITITLESGELSLHHDRNDIAIYRTIRKAYMKALTNGEITEGEK